MQYQATIYPKKGENPTLKYSDQNRPNIGICFSGGGSRALTCAWGQLLGLHRLEKMEDIRYISSVSGGTWASSIYTFLPDEISDEELLGYYYAPEKLTLSDKEEDGFFNINNLGEKALGQVPYGLSDLNIGLELIFFLLCNTCSNHKWFWAHIVGKYILKPYKLQSSGDESWNSSKQFSLSKSYAQNNFPKNSPSLDNFYFVRDKRPFLIMNNNIMEMEKKCFFKNNVVQLPNQVSPIAGGAYGEVPVSSEKVFCRGGLVESYGVCSLFEQISSEKSAKVDITLNQPYSLIDIVSTSSAFFADFIATWFPNWLNEQMSDSGKKRNLLEQIEVKLPKEKKEMLLKGVKNGLIEELLLELLKIIINEPPSIVPTYNYWSIQEMINRQRAYTDGGTLDNTGILGMLAQIDECRGKDQDSIKLVVFDNTDTPLEKRNGKIIAGSQIAPLFGIDFNEKTGEYQPFRDNQKDYNSLFFKAKSLITLFDNSEVNGEKPFDKLVQGLYDSNSGVSFGKEERINSEPAFVEIELTTVDNPLAGITGGRKVNLLYIQNAKMLNWQDSIGDEMLRDAIVKGQNGHGDFKNFPHYSTEQTHLQPKESNALSQMWAWAVSDEKSPLKNRLLEFLKL